MNLLKAKKYVFALKHSLLIYFNSSFRTTYRNSIFLRSMEKSGTNYLRLMLTNYCYNLNASFNDYKVVEYDKMHELFPNVRYHIFSQKKKYVTSFKISNKDKIVYDDFIYDHGSKLLDSEFHNRLLSPKKMILLYRNPLDIVVSRFFYFYKNRSQNKSSFTHPKDILSKELAKFINDYLTIERLDKSPDSIKVSYEELKKEPKETMNKILSHLDLPIYDKLLDFSLDASSVSKVKNTEKRIGKAIHIGNDLQGSFVRSGSIGEWKDYFNHDDFLFVKDKFLKHNISIEDFSFD